MVRKSRFLLRFLSFHEGPDPRSARAGAIETPFFTSGLGSKTVVFSLQFYAVSWYPWDRNRSTRHQKSSLKTTSWKVYVFFCSGSVFGSLLPTLWTASSCLWDVMPSKSQGFLETEGLDSQRLMSHDVWEPLALQGYCVFSHRVPRIIQKTPM